MLDRRPRRRLLVAALVALAVVVVAGGALAVVHAVDRAALDAVHAFLDARSLHCADSGDVTTAVDGEVAAPALRDASGLDCTLSVVVRNGSGRDVAVQRADFAGFGAASKNGLHTDHSFTQGLAPYPGGDPMDVVYDYAHDPRSGAPFGVGAGSVQRFEFHLTAGCLPAGTSVVTTDAPVLVVTLDTATRDVTLDGPGLGVVGTATTPCR